MKTKFILASATALAFASTAMSQTFIEITGATAFRQATMQAIYDAYDSVGDLGNQFNVAHDFTGDNISQLRASNRAIFSGNFPGITGTTVIRTSFNGSTEGLNAIAGNNNPSFFATTTTFNGTIRGDADVGGTFVTNIRPRFSFSDVYQSTSPVDNEVLQPVGSSAVGVVTFAMIANEGAPSDLTNATQQQCAALWESGILALSVFTGDPADTDFIFATGRNDGSGTRSAYLTEWQMGAATLVDQYIATSYGANGTITAITRVPANGWGFGPATVNGTVSSGSNSITFNTISGGSLTVNATVSGHPGLPANTKIASLAGLTATLTANTTATINNGATLTVDGIGVFRTSGVSNASTLWGNTSVGNGGYSSSSALRSLMGLTSNLTDVYDGETQDPLLEDANIHLLTFLSTTDSKDAAAAGAKILAYNGVQVTPIDSIGSYLGSGFSEADFNKIARGQYSAWSYQHLYHYGTLSTNEGIFRTAMTAVGGWLEDGLQATANGLRKSDMQVERAADGFPIKNL